MRRWMVRAGCECDQTLPPTQRCNNRVMRCHGSIRTARELDKALAAKKEAKAKKEKIK